MVNVARRNLCALLIANAIASGLSFAQAPAFETASVKPNNSDSFYSGFRAAGEQFTATNVRLRDLIQVAYQLRINDDRLMGVPEWAETARYTIVAKSPAGITLMPSPILPVGGNPSTLELMVRGLLADRFRLKIHTETRPMAVYALVMARRDRRLGRSLVSCSSLPDPTKCGLRSPGAKLVGVGISMVQLTNLLSSILQRNVVDGTQLVGFYDITLDYVPDPTFAFVGQTAGVNRDGPSLFTALEEQLGLKLESTRVDVDVFVIDSVTQPEPD
jgi:uncharacterized protein (TIGR03435 family)